MELERIKYRNRLQPSSELAFALLCVQLSFPHRLWELSKIFGRSEAYLSIVWTDTIEYLDSRYKRIIRWHPVLQYRRLKRYAKALQRFGGGGHIWGFLDGTFVGIARPIYRQKLTYSGYKKKHGIKFQGLVTPDGLIASLAGPFMGEVNDNRMVTESRLLAQLRHVFEDREELYLYGDQAYTQLYGIIAPYTGGREAPPHQRAFNKRMSSMRIAVENAFGLTQVLWTRNAFSKRLKIGQSAVASHYRMAVLLTNIYTCIRGNQISGRFLVRPPSLRSYLTAKA